MTYLRYLLWDEMNHILEVPFFFVYPRGSPRLLDVTMSMSTQQDVYINDQLN